MDDDRGGIKRGRAKEKPKGGVEARGIGWGGQEADKGTHQGRRVLGRGGGERRKMPIGMINSHHG